MKAAIKSSKQWKSFCVWMALAGGNTAGIIFILPALSMALGSPLWSAVWHQQFQRFGSVVLMMTVSALARVPHRRLLWIFVPPCIWLVWSILDRIVTQNWPGLVSDLHHNVPAAGLDLVFGCFIALVTAGIGRGREEPDAEPGIVFPQEEAEQEGVWPPPPSRH